MYNKNKKPVLPVIKIIGVGGGGIKALNKMVDSGMSNAEFIAIDFFADCLAMSKASFKLQLEQTHVNWPEGEFGELARQCKHDSAIDARKQIRTAIGKADVVFVVAGMGGPTGSSTAPVIAELAKETGALTIGVVTTPFLFEGQARHQVARKGIDEFSRHADTLIIIPIEAIEKIYSDKKISVGEAFQSTDDYLCSAVQCLLDLTIRPCFAVINDSPMPELLRSETKKLLTGDISIGYGTGNDRATNAAKMVISSPLLKRFTKEAQVVLIDLRAGPDFRLHEVGDAVDIIAGGLDKNREVIWDTGLEQNRKSEIDIIAIFLYTDNHGEAVV